MLLTLLMLLMFSCIVIPLFAPLLDIQGSDGCSGCHKTVWCLSFPGRLDTAQWDRILAAGPLYPVQFGVWASVIFIVQFLMFIVVLVVSFMLLWFTVVMRRLGSDAIGFGKTPWCIPTGGFVQIWFPQLHFSSVSPILLLVVLKCLLIRPGLMRNSEKAWLPYFCRSGQRDTSLEEFDREVDGWLPLLPEVDLPWLTGQMLADLVQRKGSTAGSLDRWGWREFKVLPVSWFDELARILTKVEDLGVWLDGLLDAYIAMIPKTDGDATPLGQRPLRILPIVYRIWASARMGLLDGWFRSWVPDSVFSAGSGRGSVEAWYNSALDIEEVLTGATDSDIHLFVADVIQSFEKVDRRILDRVLSSLGLLGLVSPCLF